MGRIFMITLEGCVYSCKYCFTHLALLDDIISKSFHCGHGKAYLFDKASNAPGVQEQVFITKIIKLHDKYMAYVADCFQNHTLFHK
ncbi:hypothetical protein ES332_A11G230700v1 [Gossypium tomentosum]|nr:hypothetical protein ES332_A11G230700v1 [Gossypium tomentosum]TYI01880.1 hypothetical protein ES332_A11G230700v1 [Gossypium tomentosum]